MSPEMRPRQIVRGLCDRRVHAHALHRSRGQNDEHHQQHISQVEHGRDVDVVVRLQVTFDVGAHGQGAPCNSATRVMNSSTKICMSAEMFLMREAR